jgi:hypothetical protein
MLRRWFWLGLADQVLELGEELLDRVEVGAVGRQEEEMGAGGPDGAAVSGPRQPLLIQDSF